MKIYYKTNKGLAYKSEIVKFLGSKKAEKYKGKINLIFFSPPFPLNRKKKYGNLQGNEYIEWLTEIGILLRDFLAPDGSLVMEVGNSWESGKPIMSTLALKALIQFLEDGEYQLCQQFVWYNKAKLPGPAEWVNKRRIRVKDSYTSIWWMSKTENPKADNSNVLKDYSPRMEKLFKEQSYNSGKRPSEHVISEKSFLKRNKGAIPSNVLISSNTESNSSYLRYCKKHKIVPHPARMPLDLPEFFIKFLTDENDLVFDPFSGSNTTGQAAESLNRNWIGVELNEDYLEGSKGRFEKLIR